MDYWGFNRSQVSVRLSALERIGQIDAKQPAGGLQRLAGVLSSRESQAAGGLAMYPKEFEVLVALAQSAGDVRDPEVAHLLVQQLGQYLAEVIDQEIVASPTIRAMYPSPWYIAAFQLAKGLAQLNAPIAVFRNFIQRATELWESAKEDRVVTWAFSVYGFIEGVAAAGSLLSLETGTAVFDWARNFLGESFLSELYQRLGVVTLAIQHAQPGAPLPLPISAFAAVIEDPLAYPGSAQFTLAVSTLASALVRAAVAAKGNAVDKLLDSLPDPAKAETSSLANGTSPADFPPAEHPQLLRELAIYSSKTIDTLESSQQFTASVSPQLIPINVRSIWNHFEVLAVAVLYDMFDSARAFDFFLAAAEADQVDTRDDAIYNPLRLAVSCVRSDENRIAVLTKALPGYLGAVSASTAKGIAEIFVKGIRGKPQSWLVSALYALANTLSLDEYLLRKSQYEASVTPGVSQQEGLQEIDYAVAKFAESILSGFVNMVLAYNDTQVNALAITVLSQKYGAVNQIVDREILGSYATLAPGLPDRDFGALIQQLLAAENDARIKDKDQVLLAVENARVTIAKNLPRSTPAYYAFLDHLLTLVVDAGDHGVAKQQHRTESQLVNAAKEVTTLFAPLAALLPGTAQPPLEIKDWTLTAKFRDAWFNLVVLGYSRNSKWTKQQTEHLEIMARSTPPLVSEASANQVESDLELNPVLLRGSSHTNVGNQKKIISSVFGAHNQDLGRVSFVKLMFLSAAVLVEYFRARGGIASKIALYFGDPDFRAGSGLRDLSNVASDCMSEYIGCIHSRSAGDSRFDSDAVATQLKELLILSCHRVGAVREVALRLADTLVMRVPAALVSPHSLFALLDLLTLMWQSVVDAEEDEYEPRTVFTAPRSKVTIELSDSYEVRRLALRNLLANARKWSAFILPLMNEEVKCLLTFYLDDLENLSSESFDSVAIGRSFALEMGGTIRDVDTILGDSQRGLSRGSTQPGRLADGASGFLSQYLSLAEYRANSSSRLSDAELADVVEEYDVLSTSPDPKPDGLEPNHLRRLYANSASLVNDSTPLALKVAKSAVHVPFRYFSGDLIKTGISYWLWIVNENPNLRMTILQTVADHWSRSIYRKIGLFSRERDEQSPLYAQMDYAPTNKKLLDHEARLVEKQYEPHTALIQFLKSSFHSTMLTPGPYLDIFARIVKDAMFGIINYGSIHPLSRSGRLELLNLGLELLPQYARYRPQDAKALRTNIIEAALSWYKQAPVWPYGGSLIQQRKDIALLTEAVGRFKPLAGLGPAVDILLFLMQEELNRMQVWYDPLGTTKIGSQKFNVTSELVSSAWKVDPGLAVYLLDLHHEPAARNALVGLVEYDPLRVVTYPAALQYFLDVPKSPRRRYIVYWSQVSPVESITLFSPSFGADSFLLQYAMRALETHPIEVAFFYVPQIVQSLRHDIGGYVEEYILEAAKFSQLFAHQIIWNILANSYKDDEAEVPDAMKPALDRVLSRMMDHFTPAERAYYETEFGFFNEVTSISGKLKPYIKKTKAEKKAKIDEEMALIKVPEGAYLPSNASGIVIDIDRESGRPLQSHAKAPFLAKFKIRKDVTEIDSEQRARTTTIDVWQGAIFKVGDDCRQDVLVLQLISVFRSIFNYSGLDLFVYPYKVTATGPGSGVIDMLPNSISRDMLGREAVNGLYEWYVSKHGGEDSIDFQRARNNFVKSMAAYSVISFLMQFKDRHNGNIMYDDDGHVIHIDFGFIFDLVPGGVKFEAVPFKLTKEMVAVMGGSSRTQPYRWFEELCVKAFLACRVYAEDIIRMVSPMIESGLPCFKGDTIKKFRNRFVLAKTEREAAQYMRSLISKSYESNFTKGYDEFQRLTNGIPY